MKMRVEAQPFPRRNGGSGRGGGVDRRERTRAATRARARVQVRSGVADLSYRGLARKGIGDGWPHHPWKARKDGGTGAATATAT
jgi:hypothetical protein